MVISVVFENGLFQKCTEVIKWASTVTLTLETLDLKRYWSKTNRTVLVELKNKEVNIGIQKTLKDGFTLFYSRVEKTDF